MASGVARSAARARPSQVSVSPAEPPALGASPALRRSSSYSASAPQILGVSERDSLPAPWSP
jgi:hypothetical protein